MLVGFNELKSAVFGACRIFEKDGAIEFYRFNAEQEKIILLNNDNVPDNYKKSLATSNVVIDFYSDTENLNLELNTQVATSQRACYVDVFIDGDFFAHEGYNKYADGEINLSIVLPKKEKRVTVYLPNLFKSAVTRFEIDDGATFKSYKTEKNFLFIGDSITQGYTAEYPSGSYANKISRYFGVHSINHSIGGAFFNAELISEDIGLVPDVVFVAFGTNDWSKNRDIKTTAPAFMDRITEKFPNSKIIAITPIWRGGIENKEKETIISFDEMQDFLKNLYSEYPSVFTVDGVSLVPHSSGYFINDVLHPNDNGFCEYAENLCSLVEKLKIIK